MDPEQDQAPDRPPDKVADLIVEIMRGVSEAVRGTPWDVMSLSTDIPSSDLLIGLWGRQQRVTVRFGMRFYGGALSAAMLARDKVLERIAAAEQPGAHLLRLDDP